MSSWLWPTTADVGLRTFAASFDALFVEVAHGVQNYLMSSESHDRAQGAVRHSGEWRITSQHAPFDPSFLFIAWIEEVLYRNEVHQEWLVDCMVRIEETEHGLVLLAHVQWVDGIVIEREIEIKAVTTHELQLAEVGKGETITSPWPDVPSFDGPGWYADVVFDI
ncbi:MAG: archease [Candidatus Poseidonia sp.]|nr:archease [Poseidonia sp.]